MPDSAVVAVGFDEVTLGAVLAGVDAEVDAVDVAVDDGDVVVAADSGVDEDAVLTPLLLHPALSSAATVRTAATRSRS